MIPLHTSLLSLLVATTVVAASPSDTHRQDRPNLAGHWVWMPDTTGDRPLISFCGVECVITYDGATLIVTRPGRTDGVQRYALDGTPLTHTSSFAQYNTEVTTAARWEGTTLVLARTTGSRPPRYVTVTRVDGRLIVEGEPTGRGGAPRKFVFAPKAEPSDAEQIPDRPDFSGRWTMMNPDPSSSQIPPICLLECVIVQDEQTLSVRRPDGEVLAAYRLDGAPVSTTSEAVGRKVVTTIKAYWKDQAIVIERTTGSGETEEARPPVVTTMVLEGDRLVFTRVWPGSGRGSAPARFVYQKARL